MSSTPEAVTCFIKTSTKIESVTAGGRHTLFLTQGGQVYSCGANENGQLGLGPTKDKVFEPRLIETTNIQ